MSSVRFSFNPIKNNFQEKKDLFVLVFVVAILLAIPFTVFAVLSARDSKPQAAPSDSSEQSLTDLTLEILEKGRKNKVADSRVLDLVKKRKEKILELLENNPGQVLKYKITNEVKQDLPENLKSELESEVSLEGELEVSHSDDFVDNFSKFYYDLTTSSGEKFSLHFADRDPMLVSGKKVKVRGTRFDKKVVLENIEKENFEVVEEGKDVLPASSVKKVGVIMFNFQNDTSQPFNATTVRTVLFGDPASVYAFHKENSFNLFSFTSHNRTDVDVYGWYTIAVNNSPCEGTGNDWRIPARDAATADGFSLNNYTQVIYAFPKTTACAYAGKAVISGQSSWINGSFNVGVVSHELGHNFGTGHASSYRCTAGGVNVAISDTCTFSEYGDPFDVMGNSGGKKHLNNFHKGRALWYDPGNTLTVTSSGTYTINPVEKVTTGVQALRIPKEFNTSGSPSRYYYVEYRQPFGFDNFSGSDPVVNGVSIRIGPNYNVYENTFLIDNTPSTSTYSDAPLAVNQTFTDSANQISIKTKSVSSSNATVEVVVSNSSCSHVQPGITITPTTQWTVPGGQLSYSVKVTNNDSLDCGSSTFNVTKSSQQELIQTPSTLSLSIPPGASSTSTITMSAVKGAALPLGIYPFEIQVTNTSATTFTNKATANYNVSSNGAKTGDINKDGSVNSGDLSILISTWGNASDLRADLNNDGKITSADLAILISKWGT